MIKIEALKNYTIPYCGNKRIQPYGDLVISDGENRKTCKIQDDGAKQYITFNRKRYYVRNAGRLYSPKFVIIGSIEDAAETLKEERKIQEELELSENLRKLDAKSVTAEFYFNGKSASGKIDSEDILRTLANKSDISSWNFSNGAEGKKVLAHLGADWKNRLTCDHIQKITYRGKTVFERK